MFGIVLYIVLVLFMLSLIGEPKYADISGDRQLASTPSPDELDALKQKIVELEKTISTLSHEPEQPLPLPLKFSQKPQLEPRPVREV